MSNNNVNLEDPNPTIKYKKPSGRRFRHFFKYGNFLKELQTTTQFVLYKEVLCYPCTFEFWLMILFIYDFIIMYSRLVFIHQLVMLAMKNEINDVDEDENKYNAIFNIILNLPVMISGGMIIVFKIRTIWKKMELHTT